MTDTYVQTFGAFPESSDDKRISARIALTDEHETDEAFAATVQSVIRLNRALRS